MYIVAVWSVPVDPKLYGLPKFLPLSYKEFITEKKYDLFVAGFLELWQQIVKCGWVYPTPYHVWRAEGHVVFRRDGKLTE